MRQRQTFYWFLVLSFFLSIICRGEERFLPVTFPDEYQLDSIKCLYQDKVGFIWIGCSTGLYRYNGYELEHYSNDPENSDTLINNSVGVIFESRTGKLWIGTDDGLDYFDRDSERFHHFENRPGDPSSLSGQDVETICQDDRGYLWIGTWSGGLNRLDPGTGTFTRFLKDDDDPGGIHNNCIRSLFKSRDGKIWIGFHDGGLDALDPVNQRFVHYRKHLSSPAGIHREPVLALDGDSSGGIWVGTRKGLYRLRFDDTKNVDIDNVKAVTYYLKGESIRVIHEDRRGVLRVGSFAGGLWRFNRENQEFIHIPNDSENYENTGRKYITCMLEDRTGGIWIGTDGAGVCKWDALRDKFVSYKKMVDSETGKSILNNIESFHQDRDGVTWIGTHGDGLVRFDRETGEFRRYKSKPKTLEKRSNVVLAIYEDRPGTLWVGTDGGGLGVFDRQRETFTRFYRYSKSDPNSISDDNVTVLLEDEARRFWVGTDKGINLFNRSGGTFTRYTHVPGDSNSLSNEYVLTMSGEKTETGPRIWVGAYQGGLNLFDPGSGVFKHFRHVPGNPESLSNDNVRCIHKDKAGRMWIGTDKGLNAFDPVSGKFERIAERGGLYGGAVYGILEDETGHLWISTVNGLYRCNPVSWQVAQFTEAEGLQGKIFNFGAYMKSRDGEFYFGGTNGFSVFRPETILYNSYIPPVVITDFKLFNQAVPIRTGDGAILRKSITRTHEIVLSHRDYIFSFQFAALDFTIPRKNRYAYMMEPFDKAWRFAGAGERVAPYMNIPHGHYVFRVKGSNNDGKWNEDGAEIRITITPPFHARLWFQALVILFILAVLFGGFQWRTRVLRRKIVEQERVQGLLKQSRDQMEKSRDLAELRSAENEKLIAAVSSIFIAVDNGGRVSQWNHASERFFRMKENEVKGRSLKEVLKSFISPEQFAVIMEKGLHKKIPSHNIDMRFQLKDGDERLVMGSISPIIDRGGRRFGFILLAEDITLRKKEEMHQHISKRLEALGQMAAGIAHEIRSPLQYIGDNGRFLTEAFGTLVTVCLQLRQKIQKAADQDDCLKTQEVDQLLEQKDFDFILEEIPRASEQLVNGIERVSRIVKSMNEFSRPGNGVDDRANLEDLLQTTLVVAGNRLEKTADVETRFAPDLPQLHCGSGELNQVFLNILLNAIDAVAETGKRGLIKIVTRQEGDYLVVEISDNGVGIPEDIREKIFTPFFTTKEIGKGTGQGLPYSYRVVVEGYKGKLYFTSKEGVGTTFYIHLPVNREEPGTPSTLIL